MAEKNDFEDWITGVVQRHFGGRFQLFADRVGVTFSALKRSVRNGSTSINTLLRLAIATGESPAMIFRVAGKGDTHDLITQLYGPESELRVSERAKDVARWFDDLEGEGAKAFYADSLKGLKELAQQRGQSAGTSSAKTAAGIGKSRKRGTR